MWLYLRVKYRLLRVERKVRKRYYTNETFRTIDTALKRAYRFRNPYSLARAFLQKRGEKEVHLYGETYLTTYEKIAEACQLKSTDRVLEMGSGRGRGAFFLTTMYGAHVHGVEWVPEFVGIAQSLAKAHECTKATFSCEDYMHTDLKGYTLIYLYGTALQDDQIKQLVKRFQALPEGVQIVSVSYPLTEYGLKATIKNEFSVPFLWGEATIYIQEML